MQRGPSCSAELAPQPLLDGDPWAFLLFHAVPLVNPCLPAWEVLNAQLRLCGLGQSPIPLREFYQLWLTLTFIKDVIWSCINLLMGKTCGDIPPQEAAKMAAGTLGWSVAHVDHTKVVQAAATWLQVRMDAKWGWISAGTLRGSPTVSCSAEQVEVEFLRHIPFMPNRAVFKTLSQTFNFKHVI